MKTADQEDVEDRQDDRQAEAGLPPLFGPIFASKYQHPSVFPTGLSTFITSPAAGFTAEKLVVNQAQLGSASRRTLTTLETAP